MSFGLELRVGPFGVAYGDRLARATMLGSLAAAQVEPAKAELARSGRRYAGVIGNGATFKAPVVAVPTTTATWCLYNGYPDNGDWLFVDSLGFFLASGTVAVGGTLIVAVTNGPVATVPTAYASSVTGSLNGGATGSGTKALLANAVTIPASSVWHPVIGGDWAATTTIGLGLVVQLHGGYAIPPKYGLAIDVLSGAGTTPLFGVSATWDELPGRY